MGCNPPGPGGVEHISSVHRQPRCPGKASYTKGNTVQVIRFEQFRSLSDYIYAYVIIGLDVLAYVLEPEARMFASGIYPRLLWTDANEDALFAALQDWVRENVHPEDRADCAIQIDPGRDQVQKYSCSAFTSDDQE